MFPWRMDGHESAGSVPLWLMSIWIEILSEKMKHEINMGNAKRRKDPLPCGEGEAARFRPVIAAVPFININTIFSCHILPFIFLFRSDVLAFVFFTIIIFSMDPPPTAAWAGEVAHFIVEYPVELNR